MTKKPKRPCVRGLKDFKKTGCPERCWDRATGEGCPAWKEYTIPTVEKGKPPIIRKDCIDIHQEHWQFESLKLLEGNQQATEGFRNDMCETGPDGKVYPKSDIRTVALITKLAEIQHPRESKLIGGNSR